MSFLRRRPKRRLGQAGQVLLLYLIFSLPIVMITFSVFNVGMLVSEKMKLQNAADNAAYSAAVWEARYMNLNAYVNRAMIANYDALATLVGFWSMTDSLDGFLFVLHQIIQVIPVVNAAAPAIDAIHKVVGKVNFGMATAVGANAEGSGNPGAGRAIELYNKALSFLQPGLYALNQVSRQRIMQGMAWGVDGKAQYNTFGEVFNTVSMHSRLKWDVTDAEKGLRLSTARSLNDFSDGRALRDGISIKLGPITVGSFFGVDLFFCSIGIRVGPNGFSGPPFDHVTGETPDCPGSEDTAGKCKYEIVRKDQIRQNEFFGVEVALCVTDIELGHYSDDDFNLGGSKGFEAIGINLPHIADYTNRDDHAKLFDDKGLDCSALGGISGDLNLDSLTKFEGPSAQCQEFKQRNEDDDPDNDVSPLQQTVQIPGVGTVFCNDPPPPGFQSLGDVFENEVSDLADNLPSGGAGGGGNACATAYKFSSGESMEEVKVMTYVGDSQVTDGRRIEGPTVLAYFRKRANVLPIFRGFGLTNPNDIEAYAFAKVFYAQRVGDRTDTPKNPESNKETMFNPFWAARLERPKPFGLNLLLH
jgi:hypothetical protein